MSDLRDDIVIYYQARGYTWPNLWKAMAFLVQETGEVFDQLVAIDGDQWVRNNPDNHPTEFDPIAFGTELGDVIMMAMVAGHRAGVDPIELLYQKMDRLSNGEVRRG